MGPLALILALPQAVASPPAPEIAPASPAASELPAVAAFNRRVRSYYALHLALEGPVHRVKASSDPAVVRHAIEARRIPDP